LANILLCKDKFIRIDSELKKRIIIFLGISDKEVDMLQISLPRGDIRNIRFNVTSDGTAYTDFTEVYFSVKSSTTKRDLLFQKKLSDGSIIQDGDYYTLRIESADTENLEYRKYVFDIEVVKGNIIKQTTLGELIITPEVTFNENE
jgi:hypothetical protein